MRRLATGLILVAFVAGVVEAGRTVKEYRELKPKGLPAWYLNYVAGVGEGFLVLTAIGGLAGRKPLYCPPENLGSQALSAENLR
jgi:hypothetical protein